MFPVPEKGSVTVIDVGEEKIVLFGFSVALLGALRSQLPDRSVLVVEEPDVARARGVDEIAAEHPAVARVIAAEYQDAAGLDRLMRRESAIARAAAVIPGSEYAVVPAAVVAQRIGVPGASENAARVFRDKFELRELASRAGIRNPAYALVRRIEEAERFFLAAGGRPCVLKPTARQASAGVQIITDVSQIAEGWHLTAAPDEGHRVPRRGVPSRVLCEHALQGPEYSVELLVANGRIIFRNITAKRVQPGRFPVELGHTVPAPIDAALRHALDGVNERLVSVTGFASGLLHSEWIVTDAGPALVECAARMPGDDISTLISEAWGFDLPEAYVRVLLGDQPHVPETAAGGAAVAFLAAPEGRVVSVEGLDRARRLPGVRDIRVGVGVGDVVPPVTSSWDRVGHVRVGASTAAAAHRLADEAASEITVAVRPLAPLPAR
jgi:biotin carboxylase